MGGELGWEGSGAGEGRGAGMAGRHEHHDKVNGCVLDVSQMDTGDKVIFILRTEMGPRTKRSTSMSFERGVSFSQTYSLSGWRWQRKAVLIPTPSTFTE